MSTPACCSRNRTSTRFICCCFAFVILALSVNLGGSFAGEIHEKITKGEWKQVKEILDQQPASLNEPDAKGQTPLHLAALVNHLKFAQYLIKAGAKVDATDADGRTPLFTSVQNGLHGMDEGMIKILVQAGANVNAPNIVGMSPLHEAAQRLDGQRVVYLLALGANPKLADHAGCTPLHRILLGTFGPQKQSQAQKVLHLILEKQVDVNSKNKDGDTALHLAVKRELVDIAKDLLAAGSEPGVTNQESKSPKQLAQESGNQELFKLFGIGLSADSEEVVIKKCILNLKLITAALEMHMMDQGIEIHEFSDTEAREGGYLVTGTLLKEPIVNPTPECEYSSEGDFAVTGVIRCKVHGTAAQHGK